MCVCVSYFHFLPVHLPISGVYKCSLYKMSSKNSAGLFLWLSLTLCSSLFRSLLIQALAYYWDVLVYPWYSSLKNMRRSVCDQVVSVNFGLCSEQRGNGVIFTSISWTLLLLLYRFTPNVEQCSLCAVILHRYNTHKNNPFLPFNSFLFSYTHPI